MLPAIPNVALRFASAVVTYAPKRSHEDDSEQLIPHLLIKKGSRGWYPKQFGGLELDLSDSRHETQSN
jgi:hypothetical protein